MTEFNCKSNWEITNRQYIRTCGTERQNYGLSQAQPSGGLKNCSPLASN